MILGFEHSPEHVWRLGNSYNVVHVFSVHDAHFVVYVRAAAHGKYGIGSGCLALAGDVFGGGVEVEINTTPGSSQRAPCLNFFAERIGSNGALLNSAALS